LNRKTLLLDTILIFALAAVLIWPLFKVKYVDNWASIESTFIADAHFLKEHWPHPNWQPNWYGGTRFDFVYPPALRYGTAALAKYYPRMTEARAYHIYTAFFYCLGIAGVYLFVRLIAGYRVWAWLAAIACALLSPSFLFMPDQRADSLILTPQRLGVLLRYGEGPHITAVALLPLALAAAYRALVAWRPIALGMAAVLCALVVSNNFYGATSLAICFPILVWSVWITHLDRWMAARAVAIGALAYGLTACWLTPSYIEVTMNNLKLVAQPGNALSIWVALALWMAYVLVTDRLSRGRRDRLYPTLVWGLFLFFTLNVLGHYFFNFRVTGEPGRMVPEFDMAFILFAAEGARWLWTRPATFSRPWRILSRAACVSLLVVCFLPAKKYVWHAYEPIVPYANYQDRIEYKLTEWMHQNHPHSRSLVTGSLRFWYNTWFHLPHMGGGSEQGLINQRINLGFVRVMAEDSATRALDWLQAYGIDFVVTHEAKSQEIYHDITEPRKLAPVATQIYDDGEGNLIYQVPRRYSALARVVDTAQLTAIPTLVGDGTQEIVHSYAEVMEKGPDSPVTMAWQGTDAFRLRARVSSGQSLVAMVTYDPAWHAYVNGQPVPIRMDALGQMHLLVPPGDLDVHVVFELPKQNIAGRILTVLSLFTVAGLFYVGKRKRE
jgi:hypothetical protein